MLVVFPMLGFTPLQLLLPTQHRNSSYLLTIGLRVMQTDAMLLIPIIGTSPLPQPRPTAAILLLSSTHILPIVKCASLVRLKTALFTWRIGLYDLT